MFNEVHVRTKNDKGFLYGNIRYEFKRTYGNEKERSEHIKTTADVEMTDGARER
jgi:hypothetical protein